MKEPRPRLKDSRQAGRVWFHWLQAHRWLLVGVEVRPAVPTGQSAVPAGLFLTEGVGLLVVRLVIPRRVALDLSLAPLNLSAILDIQ